MWTTSIASSVADADWRDLKPFIGGRKNTRKAMHWFEKFASKGDRIACAHLGEWFVKPGNDAKAISWLRRADGARSSLLLVGLWPKSRSVRKIMKPKHLLSRMKPEELTDEERLSAIPTLPGLGLIVDNSSLAGCIRQAETRELCCHEYSRSGSGRVPLSGPKPSDITPEWALLPMISRRQS